MIEFRVLVMQELKRLRQKNIIANGYHEAYGLILEEVDEFWEEVRKKSNKRNRVNALKELTQIAALCEKCAEDLKLASCSHDIVEDESK